MTSINKRTPVAAAKAAAAIERAVDRATEELTVLHARVAARDAEIERLQEICDDLGEHSDTYRRAAEERAGLVAALDFELQRLRADFERAKLERNNALAEARNAAAMLDQQRHEVAVVFAEVAARDAARERLQEVCDERDRLIRELNEQCAAYRQAAEERAGIAAASHEEAQRLRHDLDRIERERDQLAADAESAAHALEEERQRARLLRGEHDAALRDALRASESLRARIAISEEALSGRALVIEELQSACDERLALIERLSNEVESLRKTAAETESAAHVLEGERQHARFLRGAHDAALRDAQRASESLRARIAIIEEALSSRGRVIEELQTACDERLALIERLSDEVESLRNTGKERRLLLESNQTKDSPSRDAADRFDGDATDWREVAAERKRALEQLSAEAERRAVLLAEVTAALEGRTRENEELRGRLTRAS
jgi:chromosome segregation ATPase